MLVSGALLAGRQPRLRRIAQCAALGLYGSVLWVIIGTPTVDVLLVYAGAAVLFRQPFVHRWPVVTIVLGVLSALYLNAALVSVGLRTGDLAGYEVPYLLGLMVLGAMPEARVELQRIGSRLPALLEVVGRHPLALYGVHLTGVALLALVTR
jgi:hypothetical protein